MTFVSMTGFAESAGSHEGLRWRWEAKSVNGRSLDLRLRTPPGYDGLEPPARMLASERFRRGSLQISLTVEPQEARARADGGRRRRWPARSSWRAKSPPKPAWRRRGSTGFWRSRA